MSGKELKADLLGLTDKDGQTRRVISATAALKQWTDPLKLSKNAVSDEVPGKPTRGKKYLPKEMGFVKVHLAEKKK